MQKIPKSEIKKPKLETSPEPETDDRPITRPTYVEPIARPTTIEPTNPMESLIETQQRLSLSILTKQTIPSDNSCLFASVYFCLNDATLVGFDSDNERQMVCAMLLSQPNKFDQAFLDDKTPEVYCRWLMDVSDSRLATAAIDLFVIAVESLGRIDRAAHPQQPLLRGNRRRQCQCRPYRPIR